MYLSINLSVSLSLYLSLSIYLYIYIYICTYTYISLSLYVYIYTYVYIYLSIYLSLSLYIYIHIYIHIQHNGAKGKFACQPRGTPNLPTNIVDFGGFDSSIILILRGGIPRPMGNFPESLSQALLVGIMLVGRLGVPFTIPSEGGNDTVGNPHRVQISQFVFFELIGRFQ